MFLRVLVHPTNGIGNRLFEFTIQLTLTVNLDFYLGQLNALSSLVLHLLLKCSLLLCLGEIVVHLADYYDLIYFIRKSLVNCEPVRWWLFEERSVLVYFLILLLCSHIFEEIRAIIMLLLAPGRLDLVFVVANL